MVETKQQQISSSSTTSSPSLMEVTGLTKLRNSLCVLLSYLHQDSHSKDESLYWTESITVNSSRWPEWKPVCVFQELTVRKPPIGAQIQADSQSGCGLSSAATWPDLWTEPSDWGVFLYPTFWLRCTDNKNKMHHSTVETWFVTSVKSSVWNEHISVVFSSSGLQLQHLIVLLLIISSMKN